MMLVTSTVDIDVAMAMLSSVTTICTLSSMRRNADASTASLFVYPTNALSLVPRLHLSKVLPAHRLLTFHAIIPNTAAKNHHNAWEEKVVTAKGV
jgi:hypothetical protein